MLANDNDAMAAKTYRSRWPEVEFYEGSVGDLTPSTLESLLADDFDSIDLLVGGPPCPPFSKSRFYRSEKPRALSDPVAEVTIGGYLNVLECLRPKAFVLENVPGFAYKVHRDALDFVTSRTNELGYSTDWRILNAADFGVPQTRQRFFLIGLSGEREFIWPEPTHAEHANATLLDQDKKPWVTAGEAIGDLDTDEMADDEGHFAGGQYHDLLVDVPPGDNYLFFTSKRGHPDPKFEWRSRYWSFLLKLSPDMPSWTIQARRSNNMGPFHWRNRILRISEVKRLQTFPDDFVLDGTTEQQWRQIGNAVPPLLGEAIATTLRDNLTASL